ncbi:MAG TPA: glycosyltransferase [Ignavibacteria bacterium]|jgi:hypothetical protein
MKVFLGLNNTAGIFTSLKKGFKQLGIQADFYSFSGHIFGYETDRTIKYSNYGWLRKIQKILLIIKLIIRYKYFIFDSTGTLFPDFKDIKFFKFFGRKTMVIFTGCDIRLPDKVAKFKWNPCKDCTNDYKRFAGCVLSTKPEKITGIEGAFDILVSAEEAAASLNKKYFTTLFPFDINKFHAKYGINNKLKIIHAPSNQTYKGTKYVVEAIEKLKNEFNFDYKTISGIKAIDLYKEIESSDLVIDQMLVGFYGLLSVESMAMGKPVISYIREDIWEKIGADCPIYNANPDNLYDVLYKILSNPNQLVKVGKKSREYTEKYHDAKKIAKQYLEIFESKN